MKTSSYSLLKELDSITNTTIEAANGLLKLTDEQLNFKPAPTAWSILECLEHLNRYTAFYLPQINSHLQDNAGKADQEFKSGLWGNYLVNMVILKPNGKKMKTFAAMNPGGSALNRDVIITFLNSQQELLQYIESSKSSNLNKAGISLTFTKLIKFRLGDALRFMVYHNQRHVRQALRIKI